MRSTRLKRRYIKDLLTRARRLKRRGIRGNREGDVLRVCLMRARR